MDASSEGMLPGARVEDDAHARELGDFGFAMRELHGEAAFRLPVREAIGLWCQSEGQGTVVCPVAGPLEADVGAIVLHDVGADVGVRHAQGGRAIEVEMSRRFLHDVGRVEFGTPPPRRLERARLLDDPVMADLVATLWRVRRSAFEKRAVPPLTVGPASRIGAVALARALATRLLGHHLLQPGRQAIDVRMSAVLQHVEDYLDEPLRLDTLARCAGLSTYHFSRVFSRRMGETVGGYVRRRRVERARHLLTATDLPLAEIAFACGFAHQSHFTAAFREMVGETPGAFRTRVRRSDA